LKNGKVIEIETEKAFKDRLDNAFIFSVEHPTSWETDIGTPVEINGYCFHETEPVEMLVMHAGEKSYECRFWIDRKDVKRAYPDHLHSRHSGFKILLVFDASGEKPVWFEAFFGNGKKVKIDTGKTFKIDPFLFTFDFPIPSKPLIGERVVFKGWCFHEKKRVDKVILKVGDLSYDCGYPIERSDVKRHDHYKMYEHSGKSGFCADISFYVPGERPVWFDILFENKEALRIDCDRIKIEDTGAGEGVGANIGPKITKPTTFIPDGSQTNFRKISLTGRGPVGFTVSGKKDAHYALTLRDSFLKHNPDYEFVIFFMDLLYEKEDYRLFNRLNRRDVDFFFWPELKNKVHMDPIDKMMLFRYGGAKMNAAIRPFVFQYLMKRGYEKIVYFDFCIYVTRLLSELTELLDTHDIVSTPRFFMQPGDKTGKAGPETLQTGTSNLNFIGMKTTPGSFEAVVDWCANKLCDSEVVHQKRGIQNAQDRTGGGPVMKKVQVINDKGYGVNLWNLRDRELSKRNGAWHVQDDELAFIDFNGLFVQNTETGTEPIDQYKPSDLPGFDELFNEYKDKVSKNSPGLYGNLKYYFDYIPKTDIRIPGFVRERYNDVMRDISFPLKPDETTVKRLIRCLTRAVYSDGSINQIARWVWELRPDLQVSFPDLNNKKIRDDYGSWFRDRGQEEYALHDTFLQVDTGGEIEPAYKPDLPGINIIGYISSGFGIPESTRSFMKKSYKSGIPFAIINVGSKVHQQLREDELLEFKPYFSEKPVFDVNMFFMTADQIIDHNHDRFFYMFKYKYNVGVFWWEFGDYFDSFKKTFDYLDHVVVFTDFIKKAIGKAAPSRVKITKLPYPLLENWEIVTSGSEIRRKYGLSRDDYVFMYNFDFLSTADRKNPEAIIKAFASVFSGIKDAKLLLKTSHADQSREKLKHLLFEIDRLGIENSVIMVHETLTRNEIMSLTNAANCYVSLHRSEGFGLGMLEAMCLGKPVIATRYGGNLDFMNDDNSLLVGYSMTELKNDSLPYRKGWRWADPDIDEAASFMKRLYADRDYARGVGRTARESVKRKFDDRTFTKELYSFIESISESVE
jgi:glycosyltransferase involved in cell wall biosynthesis